MPIRFAGIALIAGVVLAFVAPAFMPGYGLINPVDQTDFAAARDALGDSAVLAHWVNFITLLSLLLMIFAFLSLYPLASRQAGLGGKILQFGIIVSIIEWSMLIIAAGMRHFEIHLMQRSVHGRKRRSVACGVRGRGAGRTRRHDGGLAGLRGAVPVGVDRDRSRAGQAVRLVRRLQGRGLRHGGWPVLLAWSISCSR